MTVFFRSAVLYTAVAKRVKESAADFAIYRKRACGNPFLLFVVLFVGRRRSVFGSW